MNTYNQEKHDKLIESNMIMSDFEKINNGYLINLAFRGINKFLAEKDVFNNNKNNLSIPWDYKQVENIFVEINNILKENKIELKEEQIKLIYKILFTHMVQFPPLCAYFGGFAAQEVIKAITNKYSPVNQIIYQDCLELLHDINIEKIINMQCLVVGAGAIGCELIKNFAMLNIGTGPNGSIYITDRSYVHSAIS